MSLAACRLQSRRRRLQISVDRTRNPVYGWSRVGIRDIKGLESSWDQGQRAGVGLGSGTTGWSRGGLGSLILILFNLFSALQLDPTAVSGTLLKEFREIYVSVHGVKNWSPRARACVCVCMIV